MNVTLTTAALLRLLVLPTRRKEAVRMKGSLVNTGIFKSLILPVAI